MSNFPRFLIQYPEFKLLSQFPFINIVISIMIQFIFHQPISFTSNNPYFSRFGSWFCYNTTLKFYGALGSI